MSELRFAPSPPREAVRRALRAALPRLGRPLRVLAEDLLGLDGRVDLVAADPAGRLVAVLLGESGEDLELVARGLAQRAWLEPRLPDWLKLAPDLDVRPGLGVGLLLVAPEFGAAARAAARALGPELVALARARFACADGGTPQLLLETEALGGETDAPAPRSATPLRRRPVFRTGLGEEDLAPGRSSGPSGS